MFLTQLITGRSNNFFKGRKKNQKRNKNNKQNGIKLNIKKCEIYNNKTNLRVLID